MDGEDDGETQGDEWCIHGQWVDGVCLCDPGKATFFNDRLLTQKYCDLDESKVVSLSVAYAANYLTLPIIGRARKVIPIIRRGGVIQEYPEFHMVSPRFLF